MVYVCRQGSLIVMHDLTELTELADDRVSTGMTLRSGPSDPYTVHYNWNVPWALLITPDPDRTPLVHLLLVAIHTMTATPALSPVINLTDTFGAAFLGTALSLV
jgi:hypothetical protein